MTDRDYFAAAALTRGMGVLGYGQIAKSCYEMADAMLRERERTNHDAVPEAKAYPSESSVPLGNGGGCGGTDKPVTLPAVGTGNTTSEAEIDALEYVVEEGRIASMDDYGILRSLLVRVRPEWEHQSYGESNKKRTNTTTNRDTTPSDGSARGEGAITDAEREAVEEAVEIVDDHAVEYDCKLSSGVAATLRSLLERLHT
jgi:hypothetical protein